MGRNYSVNGNATNTQSATLPVVTLIGTTSIRPALFEFTVGPGVTPADYTANLKLQRCTTTGTQGSGITPQPLDTADPAAGGTSGLAIFSVGPTLTANAFVLSLPINQRATYRWVALPGKEIRIPATANNGVALMPIYVSTAWDMAFNFIYEE